MPGVFSYMIVILIIFYVLLAVSIVDDFLVLEDDFEHGNQFSPLFYPFTSKQLTKI